jgi:hypothetical protein
MKEEARFQLEGTMAQCGTNKNETLLFVASKAGEFKIFDLITKQELSNTKLDNTDYKFHILTLTPDDKYCILSS